LLRRKKHVTGAASETIVFSTGRHDVNRDVHGQVSNESIDQHALKKDNYTTRQRQKGRGPRRKEGKKRDSENKEELAR
tara:strand:- start:225 stop:458 length:234 start_codon:yes stop_codon:yes gene_type:complete